MSEITVRAARAADEADVLELVRLEMEAHQSVDGRFRLRPDAAARYAVYLRDRLREIDSAVFVAEMDGKVVGTATGSIRVQEAFFETRRFGYVSDLVVAPSARRRGVGRELWRRLVLWFRGLGVSVARLHVASRSEAAQAFWKSVGAEPFLVEAWIDLPEAGVAGAGAGAPAGAGEEDE